MTRGYFGIGIYHTKTEQNVGGLWRAALNFGADFIFTIGRRYQRQPTDTPKTWRHLPLWHFSTIQDFRAHIPFDCPLIGVELHARARLLPTVTHPQRCLYVLGAEDHGLSREMIERCQMIIQIPSARCLNVAVAGAIVMYDRLVKRGID